MANDFDYLHMSQADTKVLQNISRMGEQLKKLKQTMLEKEAEAEAAKKAYEHYANVVLPTEMFAAGVNEITLESGERISTVRKYYCQPNKNTADRTIIAEWLESVGGGHLIQSEATVPMTDDIRNILDKEDVPFIENTGVNTNKLKSFIKDGLGIGSGIQKFTLDDIPKCIHFQEVTTVEITTK